MGIITNRASQQTILIILINLQYVQILSPSELVESPSLGWPVRSVSTSVNSFLSSLGEMLIGESVLGSV